MKLHMHGHFCFIHVVCFCFVQLLFTHLSHQDPNVVRYPFKEFSYVANPKYETQFQEFQSACQQSPSCQLLSDEVDKINCVRECISPSCFIELYQGDKLEAGEIDVRFDSFKGCFIQRGIRRA